MSVLEPVKLRMTPLFDAAIIETATYLYPEQAKKASCKSSNPVYVKMRGLWNQLELRSEKSDMNSFVFESYLLTE